MTVWIFCYSLNNWTLSTGGTSYDHHFNADGSVIYKESSDTGKGTREEKCAVEMITPNIHVVSYLASSGFTLTTVLNFEDTSVHLYASNEKTCSAARGMFEVLKESELVA